MFRPLSLIVALVVTVAYAMAATFDGDVVFSAGELLDIFNDMFEIGLPFPDDLDLSTLVYILSANHASYMQVENGQSGKHVRVISTTRPFSAGKNFWLKRIVDGFVTLAADVDNGTVGVGNGAREGASLYTGDWMDDASHQYAMRQVGSAVFFQNRGNAMCVSAVRGNNEPLTTVQCNTSDNRQQWQVCQMPLPPAILCWPSSY